MIASVIVSCAIALASAVPQATAPSTTIVIVRHAEAVPDAGRDPVLSEAGAARAKALAAALSGADVAAVYSTQYQRTRLTGEPVAAAAGTTVTVLPIEGDTAAYASALVARVLSTHAGRTVVIVGHSNTVPALVKAFSGVGEGDIAHDTYDLMFVVTAEAPGKARVVRARY
jgi:broad specificity phosphatase PhoE